MGKQVLAGLGFFIITCGLVIGLALTVFGAFSIVALSLISHILCPIEVVIEAPEFLLFLLPGLVLSALSILAFCFLIFIVYLQTKK